MLVPTHRRLALIPILSCALAGTGRAEEPTGHPAPDPHALPPVEKYVPPKPADPHAEVPAVPPATPAANPKVGSHHASAEHAPAQPHASPAPAKPGPPKAADPHAEVPAVPPATPAATPKVDSHHASAEHAPAQPHASPAPAKPGPPKAADPHAEVPAVPPATPRSVDRHDATSHAGSTRQSHDAAAASGATKPADHPAPLSSKPVASGHAHAAPAASAGSGHGKPASSNAEPAHAVTTAHGVARSDHTTRDDRPGRTPATANGDPAFDSPELRELLGHLRELEAEVGLVRREHADPPEADALWAAARRGLVQALDPHSSWLDRDEVALRGSGDVPLGFGFGFDWVLRDGRPTVVRVVPGSSADAAGLEAGQRIERAGDIVLDGLPGAALVRAFNGLPDRAALTLVGSDGSRRTVEVTRGELADTGLGVCAAPDARGIARIGIGRFFAPRPDADGRPATASTAQALAAAVAKVGSARAIVLDLRGCGGGNLQVAVDALACFLPAEAVVAHQVSRNPARNRTLVVPQTGARFAGPLAVLLDRHSASAAEVFAAALQHHRRAVVVGERSAGKTSVQQLFLLPSGDAMLLTVARLRRPDQSEPAGGIEPDIPAARQAGAVDAVIERARDALAAILAAGR